MCCVQTLLQPRTNILFTTFWRLIFVSTGSLWLYCSNQVICWYQPSLVKLFTDLRSCDLFNNMRVKLTNEEAVIYLKTTHTSACRQAGVLLAETRSSAIYSLERKKDLGILHWYIYLSYSNNHHLLSDDYWHKCNIINGTLFGNGMLHGLPLCNDYKGKYHNRCICLKC